MTKFIAIILGCTFSLQAYAKNENCSQLAEGIKVTFPQGLPDTLQAGTTVTIPLKFEVEDKLLEPFRTVPVSISFSNGQIGARSFQDFFFLKETSPTNVELNRDFQFHVHFTKNVLGTYQFEADLAFYDEQNGVCAAKIKNDESASITLLNDPSTADTYAPTITSVRTDQATYATGQNVLLRFDVLDKSPICTKEKEEEKICETVGHIAFIHSANRKEFDAYPRYVEQDDQGYYVSFEINTESEFMAGQYRVIGINISDIWGNHSHNLIKKAQTSFEIQ